MTPSRLAAVIAAKHIGKLSDAELFLLSMLATNTTLRPRDIINAMGITPAGISGAAKKLIARKLITKTRDDHKDERSIRYTIKPEGRRVIELITQAPDIQLA